MRHTEIAIYKSAFRKAIIAKVNMGKVAIEKFTIFIASPS